MKIVSLSKQLDFIKTGEKKQTYILYLCMLQRYKAVAVAVALPVTHVSYKRYPSVAGLPNLYLVIG